MFRKLFAFILFFIVLQANAHHQQIHLSFGQNVDEMIVTWITKHNDHNVHVRYGLNTSENFDFKTKASTSKYVNPGKEKRVVYIHRAILKNLKSNQFYKYRTASSKSLGPIYVFKSRKIDDTNQITKFAMFADMGLEGTIISKLANEAENYDYDMVFHVGDIAYDLHKDNGRVGDKFMHEIETIAAKVAYQVAPGNHERKDNFSQYVNRFTMIDQDSGRINNHYYSFDMNNIHFVVYSTEFYYYTQFGTEQIKAQYNWLKEDLRKANSPENRAQRPWIIVMAHRSMYCNGFDLKDCIGYEHIFRNNVEFSLEELFYENSVDLSLVGHEHAYVKLYPVFNSKVMRHSTYENALLYKNPESIINVVSGSASNNPNDIPEDIIDTEKPEWVAKWSIEPSYSRITVYNHTTLVLEQVSSDLEEERLIDKLILKKTLYRSYRL